MEDQGDFLQVQDQHENGKVLFKTILLFILLDAFIVLV